MKAVIHRNTLIGFWASLVGWIGAMSYAYTYGSEQLGSGLSLVAYLLMIPVSVVVISIANALGCFIDTGILGGKARAVEALFCFACSVAVVALTSEFFIELLPPQNSGFLSHVLTMCEVALLQAVIIILSTGVIIRLADILPDLTITSKQS